MPPREMTMDEKIIRQSIVVYQATIEDLCRRRDELIAMLPNAPRQPRLTIGCGGREIRQGGGKKRKKVTDPTE